MSNSGMDLEHNTYAFWKDNVECSGGSCKIYTGNLTDYNNARELERTQWEQVKNKKPSQRVFIGQHIIQYYFNREYKGKIHWNG